MMKALGSWSGMRKYLEQEMLAIPLHGRVRYNCTRYVGMENCHIFEVYIDDILIKQFSWETVNSYFISQKLASNEEPFGIQEYWQAFWTLLAEIPLNERTEYTDDEFCEALTAYRNQPIQESLASNDPMVRMFAILDRRVGKRTLERLKEKVAVQPAWLQAFYMLRLEAEQIRME